MFIPEWRQHESCPVSSSPRSSFRAQEYTARLVDGWHWSTSVEIGITDRRCSCLYSLFCPTSVVQFSSVQFSCSEVDESLRPHGLQHIRLPCPSPIPGAYSNLSIESVMPSNHLILYCPLLLTPSIFPRIMVFSNELVLRIRYWSFSVSPSNEYSGLISFRIDWFDLLAVQGTLKNLLQHHSSKASILLCSDFFIVQLSHPYMTIGKTIALTTWTFVGNAMSLFFNMLSRLVIAFLPRSKCLLISWLQSPSAVILELPKIKVSHCFYFPIYLSWSDGTRFHDLGFLNVEF